MSAHLNLNKFVCSHFVIWTIRGLLCNWRQNCEANVRIVLGFFPSCPIAALPGAGVSRTGKCVCVFLQDAVKFNPGHLLRERSMTVWHCGADGHVTTEMCWNRYANEHQICNQLPSGSTRGRRRLLAETPPRRGFHGAKLWLCKFPLANEHLFSSLSALQTVMITDYRDREMKREGAGEREKGGRERRKREIMEITGHINTVRSWIIGTVDTYAQRILILFIK